MPYTEKSTVVEEVRSGRIDRKLAALLSSFSLTDARTKER
jgi:hypothetical protein